MARRLEGKAAIVTGGAGGIGSSTARLFVDEGARVVIGDVADDAGEELAASLGDAAAYVHLDVTDPVSWAGAIAQCEQTFGPPTVLINGAGALVRGMVADASAADFERAFAVNCLSVLFGMQAVLPAMRASGGGSIVNIVSMSGYGVTAGLSPYGAAKAANRHITKCAAIEFGPYGIRVNAVHPGGIDTPMRTAAGGDSERSHEIVRNMPIPRVGTPSELAHQLLWLASDDSSYTTGGDFIVDGGMSVR